MQGSGKNSTGSFHESPASRTISDPRGIDPTSRLFVTPPPIRGPPPAGGVIPRPRAPSWRPGNEFPPPRQALKWLATLGVLRTEEEPGNEFPGYPRASFGLKTSF